MLQVLHYFICVLRCLLLKETLECRVHPDFTLLQECGLLDLQQIICLEVLPAFDAGCEVKGHRFCSCSCLMNQQCDRCTFECSL